MMMIMIMITIIFNINYKTHTHTTINRGPGKYKEIMLSKTILIIFVVSNLYFNYACEHFVYFLLWILFYFLSHFFVSRELNQNNQLSTWIISFHYHSWSKDESYIIMRFTAYLWVLMYPYFF